MEIKSDLSHAQTYATRFLAKRTTLEGIAEPNKDDRTTVAGNVKAHEALSLAKANREKISQVIESASHNLHSVASEFEAVDREIATGM